MHILYVVQYFNLPDEPGGGRAYHFARYWVEQGHRVTVLTGTVNHKTGSIPERYRGRLFTREELHGIELIRCASTAGARAGFLARIVNFLGYALLASIAALFVVPRPDVVYASSTPLTVGLPGWLASMRWGRPLVFEVRDLWPESAVVAGVLRNRLIIGLASRFERFLYRWSRRVVALTRGIADGVARRGTEPEKIAFIPNGVDDLLVEASPNGATRDGDFVCIYVGAMGPWNGNETLVEAARLLKDDRSIRFVFVGDGGQRAELEEKARAWGLDRVDFLGARPKREAMDRIARADLCMICTWDHPFHRMVLANKIFDYLGAGKPVVAAAAGEMADLLAECEAGYAVAPGDAEGLAELIARVRALPADERRAMGNRGREHVLRHYQRRHLATRAVGLMEEVAREELR